VNQSVATRMNPIHATDENFQTVNLRKMKRDGTLAARRGARRFKNHRSCENCNTPAANPYDLDLPPSPTARLSSWRSNWDFSRNTASK
jgi:hypothetical protein